MFSQRADPGTEYGLGFHAAFPGQTGLRTSDQPATGRENRRCYHLELTDEGCRLYHKSYDLIRAWNEQKLSVLTPDEQAQLTTLLEKIVQAEGENSHV